MLAWHPLISSCFSWNHGRRGCLGPGEEKRRSEVYSYRWSEVTACGRNDSVTHGLHATRCQTTCRGDKKDRSVRKKATNTFVMLWYKKRKGKKKPLMVVGPLKTAWWQKPYSHEHFHLTTAQWQTREHAANKKTLHRYKRKTICYQSRQYIFTVKDNSWS